MVHSRNGLTAIFLSLLGSFLILLAFTTKSWLVTDGLLKHPKFERMGLWVVCFKYFEDSHHWYDTRFHSCRWVFDEKYFIIYDILFKGFYIATQFWFTACILLTGLGLYYTILYMYLNRAYKRYAKILLTAGILYIAAAVCGSIALIIFGIDGDSRIWMPHWEHNDVGWSYGVAVTGTIALYVSGVLYVIEGRIKCQKMATQRANNNYNADDKIQNDCKLIL